MFATCLHQRVEAMGSSAVEGHSRVPLQALVWSPMMLPPRQCVRCRADCKKGPGWLRGCPFSRTGFSFLETQQEDNDVIANLEALRRASEADEDAAAAAAAKAVRLQAALAQTRSDSKTLSGKVTTLYHCIDFMLKYLSHCSYRFSYTSCSPFGRSKGSAAVRMRRVPAQHQSARKLQAGESTLMLQPDNTHTLLLFCARPAGGKSQTQP